METQFFKVRIEQGQGGQVASSGRGQPSEVNVARRPGSSAGSLRSHRIAYFVCELRRKAKTARVRSH